MKFNGWNMQLELTAENEQDTLWLNDFVERLDNFKILGNYFLFDIGCASYEGGIELESVEDERNQDLNLEEAKSWLKSGVTSIVRMKIVPYGEMCRDWVYKAIKSDFKKINKLAKEINEKTN